MTTTTLDEYACQTVEADFEKDTITVKMEPGYRVRAGKHWLLTDAAYQRLCSKSDPQP